MGGTQMGEQHNQPVKEAKSGVNSIFAPVKAKLSFVHFVRPLDARILVSLFSCHYPEFKFPAQHSL